MDFAGLSERHERADNSTRRHLSVAAAALVRHRFGGGKMAAVAVMSRARLASH
jgi:hypothetical protein